MTDALAYAIIGYNETQTTANAKGTETMEMTVEQFTMAAHGKQMSRDEYKAALRADGAKLPCILANINQVGRRFNSDDEYRFNSVTSDIRSAGGGEFTQQAVSYLLGSITIGELEPPQFIGTPEEWDALELNHR